jgi:hypothetical protein
MHLSPNAIVDAIRRLESGSPTAPRGDIGETDHKLSKAPQELRRSFWWEVLSGRGDNYLRIAIAWILRGSSMRRIWSARTFLIVCGTPLGHRISIVATVSAPRPKCTRLSLDDR